MFCRQRLDSFICEMRVVVIWTLNSKNVIDFEKPAVLASEFVRGTDGEMHNVLTFSYYFAGSRSFKRELLERLSVAVQVEVRHPSQSWFPREITGITPGAYVVLREKALSERQPRPEDTLATDLHWYDSNPHNRVVCVQQTVTQLSLTPDDSACESITKPMDCRSDLPEPG
eukprot:5776880-Pyramimonas_sp.AAC.1